MGIINHLFSGLLLADMPPGLWQTLIGYVVDFVGDYGLAIILFTIVLKIILSPLDFMQKKITKSNTEKQAKLQPALEKLNKKYANNKEMLNQKTMELYKKENYNIFGTCLGMLLNIVLTLVIFITLFTAMRNISQYKLINQYDALETAYTTAYDANYTLTSDELQATAAGQAAVLIEYENVKEGFLWVNNLWMPDTYASIIPDYNKFLSLTAQTAGEAGVPTEDTYNYVMTALQTEYDGWNGLFILIVLAAAITFLSQKVMMKFTRPNKPTSTENPAQQSGQIMLYLLPILMVVFTISYSAAFALYIVINSGMSMVTSVVSYKILHKLEQKKEQKNKAEYSR